MKLWQAVPPGAREVPRGGYCPRCRSRDVRRRRTLSVMGRFWRAVSPMRPFRCQSCSWSGWSRVEPSQGPENALPPVQVTGHRDRHRPSRRTGASDTSYVASASRETRARLRRRQIRFAVAVVLVVAALAWVLWRVSHLDR